jgi:UDP-MurNAc hydroxylase
MDCRLTAKKSGIAFAFPYRKPEVFMFPSTPFEPQPVSFRILSHAGLSIQGAGKNLVFDPWLVGSAYWRSWWNYPPVPRGLAESLKPDFICLTRIHWDHFHGPSLRKFARETPILIPRIPFQRMKKDLREMRFLNVIELRHGRAVDLAPGLRITSYQFHPFNDSAAVVECGGVTFFNATDARIADAPLRQVLKNHPCIDFVFRGQDRAEERMSFDYMDAPIRDREDMSLRLRAFSEFTARIGARYAIPLAGNRCYLHRETFHLNHTVTSPLLLEAYCRAAGGPEAVPMLPGDSWSQATGFDRAKLPYLTDRERCLREYAAEQAPALEKFYALEARTATSMAQVEGYFSKFIAALPGSARRMFRGKQVTWVLSGKITGRFWVDIDRGVVRELSGMDDENHPLQIYTSAYIFRRCMAQNLFIHLALSKRVLFRCSRADAKYIHLLIALFSLYECGMLPAWKMLTPRFLFCWIPRWREAGHYASLVGRHFLGRLWPTQRPFSGQHRPGMERPAPHIPISPGTANTRGYRPKKAAIAVPGGSQL